jgi:hypothetical protein
MPYLVKDKDIVKVSEWPGSWKPIPERMTGNFVISYLDAVMYAVLIIAGKHVPFEELVLVLNV